MGFFDFLSGTKKSVTIVAPCSGKVLPITDVPDATFAEKILGDGFAIEPREGTFVAPVAGMIITLPSSLHAFALQLRNGTSLLVHVGLDTVTLKGAPFKSTRKVGEVVAEADQILVADLDLIRASKGVKTITPVIILDDEEIDHLELLHTSTIDINAGEPFFRIHFK